MQAIRRISAALALTTLLWAQGATTQVALAASGASDIQQQLDTSLSLTPQLPGKLLDDASRAWIAEQYASREDPYVTYRNEANESFEGVSKNDRREVVCWGDSLTEGYGASEATIKNSKNTYDASYKGYPRILQDMCNLKTYNCGVAGATSYEIAAMQGGLDADALGLPLYTYDETVVELGKQHPGDILILEIGSNGGWGSDYDVLYAQLRSMIVHSGCSDYLIVGDTDDPGTSVGDLPQLKFKKGEGPGETGWEAALRERFGSRFLNTRVYLIENGLQACGLSATSEDRNAASYGCVPGRLRADWTHLNSYGYYAQARAIYERGVQLGFWK